MHIDKPNSDDDEITDRHKAITLRHISPTAVLWFDREAGRQQQRNGGYAEVTFGLERGHVRVVKWLYSMLPQQWRRDLKNN